MILPFITPDSSEHKNASPRATSIVLVNFLKGTFCILICNIQPSMYYFTHKLYLCNNCHPSLNSALIKKKHLSYARLGNFMLSNNINKFINPTKIPFTFRMYPTFHDY